MVISLDDNQLLMLLIEFKLCKTNVLKGGCVIKPLKRGILSVDGFKVG